MVYDDAARTAVYVGGATMKNEDGLTEGDKLTLYLAKEEQTIERLEVEGKGDNVYAGKVSVKLGPMTAGFEGEATVTPDASGHICTIDGMGVDRRGGSRGHVKVTYRVEPAGETTSVTVDADLLLSGQLEAGDRAVADAAEGSIVIRADKPADVEG